MENLKTKILVCLILAASVLFVSATVWEGAASVGPARDLRGETYSVATNSFPRNTVIDVTNLENNRTVRVLVVSGLNNSGLLASLSRDAADAIGMNGDSVRRVRITHPSDSVAFAHIRRGPLPYLGESGETAGALADPSPEAVEIEPAGAVSLIPAAVPAPEVESWISEVPALNEPRLSGPEPAEAPEFLAADTEPETAGAPGFNGVSVVATPNGETLPEPSDRAVLVSTITHMPQIYVPAFRLVPTEERIPSPEQEHVIDPAYLIPPIERAVRTEPEKIAEEPAPEPAAPWPYAAKLAAPPAIPPPPAKAAYELGFELEPVPARAPFEFVGSLQRDKWYVQLGAFKHHHSVEEKIERIGMAYPYPVLIQSISTDEGPRYRVLIGPLNQGESAAVLRRVRSVGNVEAFARQGEAIRSLPYSPAFASR